MIKNEVLNKVDYASVGEAISHELAAKMIKDFQDAHPNASAFNSIGRNIIEKILAQPGCVAMRFYNGINEVGRETLVYAGVDAKGKTIIEIVAVDEDGQLARVEALIGDRTQDPGPGPFLNWF